MNSKALAIAMFGVSFLCLTFVGFLYYGWIAIPVGVLLFAGVIWERFYKV